MASADQLKALLKSHLEGDDQRFFSVAMELAAHEAKLGHGRLSLSVGPRGEEIELIRDAFDLRWTKKGGFPDARNEFLFPFANLSEVKSGLPKIHFRTQWT